MARPDAANPRGRDLVLLGVEQLRRRPGLTERGELDRELADRRFDLLGNAILPVGLAPTDLAEALQAGLFIAMLHAVERVAGVAHDLAGFAHVPQVVRQL